MQTIFIALSIVFTVTIVLNIVLIIRSPGLKRHYESRLKYQEDIIHTLQRQLYFYLREWCKTRADKTGESESEGKSMELEDFFKEFKKLKARDKMNSEFLRTMAVIYNSFSVSDYLLKAEPFMEEEDKNR